MRAQVRLEEIRPKTKLYILLALVCVLHLAVFGLMESRPHARLTNDSEEYLRAGYNLFNRGVLYSENLDIPIALSHYTKRTPAYVFVVGAMGVLGDPVRLTILLQIALNLAAATALWRLGRVLGLQPGYRLLLSGLFLLYPAQIVYTHTIMTEVMFEIFVVLAVALVAAFLKSRSEWLLVGANLALGLGVLTRPVLVYFWIPSLLFHAWLAYRHRRPRLAVWALIPVLFISAWSYRNQLRTGDFHYSSIDQATLKLRMAWRPGFQQKWEEREKAGQTLASDGQYLRRAYLEDRLKNWPHTLWSHAVGMTGFFLDPGRYDVYQIFGMPDEVHIRRAVVSRKYDLRGEITQVPSPILAFLAVMFPVNLFITIAFAHCLISRRLPLEFRVFVGLLTVYLVVITGSIGASRYRLAIEPILLLGVPFFVAWLRERHARRSLAG